MTFETDLIENDKGDRDRSIPNRSNHEGWTAGFP